jgi:phosphoribosylaminoimidazole-succinocarboxamide synthase
MEKKERIYEGKAKKVFTTDNPEYIIQDFKDDATAFDGKKKGKILEKGIMNNSISSILFELLEGGGIKTHFVKTLSPREMLCLKLKMIPIEVIVRNIAAGSLAKRLGYDEGKELNKPVVEYYYKSDELGDPILNQDHINELGLISEEKLKEMKEIALRINEILKDYFDKRSLILVDFKLEFGEKDNEILLGDEISPDTCRFWDKETGEKLDKDRFRRDLGKVEEAYQEVLGRIKKKI